MPKMAKIMPKKVNLAANKVRDIHPVATINIIAAIAIRTKPTIISRLFIFFIFFHLLLGLKPACTNPLIIKRIAE